MSKLPQTPPLLTDDPFRLWVPLVLEPDRDSLFKSAAELPDSVLVKGLVSSDLRDLDGELVRQDGIDWSWFLTPGQGALTYGHTQWALRGPIVGRPRRIVRAKLEDGTAATWLEGNLWLRSEYGLKIFRDHQAALAAGDPGMGFSIEGTALERDPFDPSIVIRAIVYSVAIAFQPKNTVAELDPIGVMLNGIAKAMGAEAVDHTNPFTLFLAQLRDMFVAAPRQAAPPPALPDPARLTLLKGVSDDDLRALRLARKCPDLPFAAVAAEVQRRQHQGNDR